VKRQELELVAVLQERGEAGEPAGDLGEQRLLGPGSTSSPRRATTLEWFSARNASTTGRSAATTGRTRTADIGQ
jgi:hypothetical protein